MLEVVRGSDGEVWHRTDILGCSRRETLDVAERREVAAGDALDATDRCVNCTW